MLNSKYDYFMNGEHLPPVGTEKDLGVHTINALNWGDTYYKVCEQGKIIDWLDEKELNLP